MGWWAQSLGVRGAVPAEVATAADGLELSYLTDVGWSWVSLAEDWSRDLGELAGGVSSSGAPALAFLVADSDLAIVYAAAPGEPVAVASTGEYEEPGPPTEADAFASWSARWAPRAVEAERFVEWSQTAFVFAEEGVQALLAELGLAEPLASRPETL